LRIDSETRPATTAKMFLIRCDSSLASRSRLSDSSCASWMSTAVPNQRTGARRPVTGTARAIIQRYSPSWRRTRCWIS
jgi:hypothetical protein